VFAPVTIATFPVKFMFASDLILVF